ncbi:conidial yellow pigment biosynthesis polyketide synthase [Coleophoma cylindrospora]|uniref:Conidial yellow pigment biosynthesis polyketide synthase n=1 Tax=Coleophoma cylindrospora TaxID=1849047 RepID=A0A3D8QPQ6_9HELO|nr:conidial yellow pigment biosynthesis polyketide synthase [Coleophoma cylindrospora]
MVLHSHRKVFLFGPHALAFDIAFFNRLRTHLHDEPGNRWVLDLVSQLPSLWGSLVESVPTLQSFNGEELLQVLSQGLQTGNIPQSIFPLPNILLTPLVVITQLTQYSTFLKAALPDLDDTNELPASLTGSTEILGLCTGILSSLAAACSPTLATLRNYGAVAVRLAMIIGALVDANEASPSPEGISMSFSMSWSSAESGEHIKQLLEEFPEAYVSVFVDEKRSTVTTSKQTAPALIRQLELFGAHVTEVALSGRFHWIKNLEDTEKLIRLCDSNPEFQFRNASNLVFPTRLGHSSEYVTNSSSLHEIALREILVQPSQWLQTFNLLYSSHMSSGGATVILFGPERCVPPTVARKLGSQLISVSDMELSNSLIPRALLGQNSAHESENVQDQPDDRIAVIGMSCQVAGADDLEEYWKILVGGQSQHCEVPPERFDMGTAFRELDPKRKWYGNFIQHYDTFDHKFFKKSPREMASTDPQHRLVLQLAYQAVEQSGYFTQGDFEKHIGCYIGVGNVDYANNIACYDANAYSATGNLRAFIAGKVSHYFGWTGPSLTIDTACSSSAVAIHQACRAIINGECTTALAGGVNVLTSPEWFHNLAGASFLSPTGQCKPFDAKGDGYCRGDAVGMVFLKKLSSAVRDGDQVLGVIASTRVYQNQNCTAITVPNALSLSELFADVVQQARLEPRKISVVEAHGTGTPVGDPAEYDSIRRVFGGSIRSDMLYVSSVKGLIGHTEFASGIVSLIKVLLMIQKGFITPQASFTSINPSLNAVPEDRMDIPLHLKPWEAGFRAALINNYGASGSNASMIITEAPKAHSKSCKSLQTDLSSTSFPFWFSGLDVRSLGAYAVAFTSFLQRHANSAEDLSVSNLSFQLSRQSNRSLPQALIINAKSSIDLQEKLSAFARGDKSITAIQPAPPRPVILCFGGQVSTYVGLPEEICDRYEIFKYHLDQCDTICHALGIDSIYPEIFQRSPVQDVVKLQTMLFATQYSCARAWIECGIQVAAVVGHSFGELTALCIAGVYSLNDALKLISGRARLIRDTWGVDGGSMLAVEGDLQDVLNLLAMSKTKSSGDPGVSIACYNGPRSFTLGGPIDGVKSVEDLAKSSPAFSGIRMKKLNVTNAFHSALVNPLMGDLEELGQKIVLRKPTIQVERATESKHTGILDYSFVAHHLRNPVFFDHAVHRLAKEYPGAVWLECGSNSTVTKMASRALGDLDAGHHFQSVNITSNGYSQFLVDATTELWKEGVNVSFWAHHAKQVSRYTPLILPPYQFEKSRHWMELKEMPKLEAPVVEPAQQVEVLKGLTTFIGYQDDTDQLARFMVNMVNEKFQQLTHAHIVGNTTAVTPGIFHFEISLDALMYLRPEFKDFSFQPQIRDISYHNLLVPDASLLLYLDLIPNNKEGLVWTWRLHSTDLMGTATDYSSGKIVFQSGSDLHLKDSFDSLVRLSGRKRCVSLLQDNDADDVLQGRNIYRAFEKVIHYEEPFRQVSKIVGKNNESAALVTMRHCGATWIDPILTECFCQVASIFINLMTDAADLSRGESFVCDRITQWIRNPNLDAFASLPEKWEVFAVHHQESGTKYVSDLFAFDSRDGSLFEAILGICHRRVPIEGIHKTLGRAALSENELSTTVMTPAPTPDWVPNPLPTASISTSASLLGLEEKRPVPKATKKPVKKPVKKAGLDVSTNTREIVCNLSGLEPEDIKDDSDLIELGIDSLMAMELVREVYASFKCTLENDQLMDLTDFRSLVICIQSTLGIDDEDGDSEVDDGSSPEAVPEPILESSGTTQNVHGMNGVNGVNSVNEDHGLDDGNSWDTVGGLIGTNDVAVFNRSVHDLSVSNDHAVLATSTVLDVFYKTKWSTDDAIIEGQLGGFSKGVMPRSTELCLAYIVEAFEQLGCPIRSAASGDRLRRVNYLPKHEKYMNLIYDLLEKDARLIDINGSEITRTAVAPPAKSAETLLNKLLQEEPVHAAEFKLTALVGSKFANLITGKEDGLQLIFGAPESRALAVDWYATSPVNTTWIKQLEQFLENLIGTLPKGGQPIKILEIGAGTGGTTSKIVPMLARLGVPVKYVMTDISGSLIAAARKRFKHYPFIEFKALNMEVDPDPQLLESQHIILATNCVHATRDLSVSLRNLRRMLRPDGFLVVLEMTEQVPWVDFIFGLLEGWWLFEDGRDYVLQPPEYWEKVLQAEGYGHVDWTDGDLPEAGIQRLIIAHASGPKYDHRPKPSSRVDSQHAGPSDVEREEVINGYVSKYIKDFTIPSHRSGSSDNSSSLSSGLCVLVTGATGSLGAHIVAYLAQRPDIHTVVCLNRLSAVDATTRQHQTLEMRGISLDAISLSKLKVFETDTSKPRLGLSLEKYEYLVRTVTHIVHSAWPMSLTRPIRTYETQFKIVKNLMELAIDVTNQRPAPFKLSFQFISSIAVVANYPLWTGKPVVPEEPGTIKSLPLTGYAEAKLVTERILSKTLYCHPDRFHTMAVRIAQISGSTSNGYWNPTEYMPFLVKSSQVLKVLPKLDGTLSWYPVDGVAATLGELLVADTTTDLIYHIDNPSRQTWVDLIATLSDALELDDKSIIPYDQWVNRVRRFRGSTTDNPALQLIEFFEHYFIPMSCGGLILDTTKAQEHSGTLQNQGPINDVVLKKYVAMWKRSGFLNL